MRSNRTSEKDRGRALARLILALIDREGYVRGMYIPKQFRSENTRGLEK